jgi:hypothetical protein
MAGHASGRIQGNMHARVAEDTPQANGLLTVINKLGVDVDHVGDSTDTIAI